jgi:hypothetical protein
VALALRWQGAPSYERILAFAEGIRHGLARTIERRRPLYLMLDGDVAQTSPSNRYCSARIRAAAVRPSAFIITNTMPMITGRAMIMGITITAIITTMIEIACRKLGLLPPPLAGEGWGGSLSDRVRVPPPCPSPARGGGDAEAPAFACERARGARP